tara:strand:- start:2444 stop:2731 length:288 start_codon:yes stop_codon:yes gene_type:complete
MKAYWVAIYKSLDNTDNLEKYKEIASTAIKNFNGKFLVRGGKSKTLEGPDSPRTVIIEFSSLDDAINCYHSEEYQKAKKVAGKIFNRQIQIVEGI